MRKLWFRGGEPTRKRVWWSATRVYAEFYDDEVSELVLTSEEADKVLDLSDLGGRYDAAEIERRSLPSFRPGSGDMYEWAERVWEKLGEAGFLGVVVMQWHADYSEEAQKTLLFWG